MSQAPALFAGPQDYMVTDAQDCVTTDGSVANAITAVDAIIAITNDSEQAWWLGVRQYLVLNPTNFVVPPS